jgi:hypothetical protein
MAGNREYKSDVFSMLMEDKRNALELYNAVNGSDYADPELIEMHTLDKGISLTVRNDAAFVLDMNLSVYEHQSTVCPNMPVRELIYFTYILERMIRNRNIYGRSLVRIPIPRFAVFYNGQEDQPAQYDMRLSDAFEHSVEQSHWNPNFVRMGFAQAIPPSEALQIVEHPEIELICKVYNINFGYNKELLDKCPV